MGLVFAPSEIETWPIDGLRPCARNAKTHAANQVAKIATSRAKFEWTVPCLAADDGELIAGHGRHPRGRASRPDWGPPIILSHLTDGQRWAYRIANNQLAEFGGIASDVAGQI